MAKHRKKPGKMDRHLPELKPNAAGVDMGAREIFVSVPADRDAESVRSFPTFTEDLHRLADWLTQCRIDTVAMESTGVYWIPLFQILESRSLANSLGLVLPATMASTMANPVTPVISLMTW